MLFARRPLITQASRSSSAPALLPLPRRLLTNTAFVTQITNMTNKTLDPYTAKTENDNLSRQEKFEGLYTIVKSVKTGMLTTRDKDGNLHSRAMTPAGRKSLFFF